MSTPTTTERSDTSLARDLVQAARYYLRRPRVLLTLATIAIIAGLVFNWSWLVAVGLAPILLSTLPCLIMCGVGACMMCRTGEKQSAPLGGAVEEASPPATLAVAATDRPSAGVSSSTSSPHSTEAAAPPTSLDANPLARVASCCEEAMNEAKAQQALDPQPTQDRRDSHA